MTRKERMVVLTIFVSVLGIAFISALKPVARDYVKEQTNLVAIYNVNNQQFKLTTLHYTSTEEKSSKIVNMLSEVLGLPQEDVKLALDGGSQPSAMLASVGILLSDIADDYSFDIVGDNFIRFRV